MIAPETIAGIEAVAARYGLDPTEIRNKLSELCPEWVMSKGQQQAQDFLWFWFHAGKPVVEVVESVVDNAREETVQ